MLLAAASLLLLIIGLWIYQMPARRIKRVIAKSKYKEYADLIVAIARHETDNFKSSVFKKNKNAFGYGHDGHGNYYKYSSVEDSAADFLRWMNWHTIPAGLSPEQFISIMRDLGYYEDSLTNYYLGVKRFLKQ